MFRKHPRGLPVLFFTEMWERFGFYLMLGIFTLYMIDTQSHGLGLSVDQAADIYGTYIALVYLAPFFGGLLADRVLGYRLSVAIGGTLMGLGYLGLAIPGLTPAFWGSLALIILGNGLFKPNISTLVGNLYSDPRYRPYKDAGFNIFYMGINLGAFICNFVAAYLRNSIGWGAAFASAGVGMFIGVVWFLAGSRHVAVADVRHPRAPGEEGAGRTVARVFGPALAFALVGWFAIPAFTHGGTLFGSRSNDAFLLACVPVAWFYVSLWRRARGEVRERIGSLLPIFAVVIVFWAVFNQNGSALTVWAERYTDRTVSAPAAKLIGAAGLAQTADATPHERPLLDAQGEVAKDARGQPRMVVAPDAYFDNVPDAERPPPGARVQLISTELFQSVNPFFVIAFTPLVVGFFGLLRRRGREPSTPGKVAAGLFITAASTLLMIAATVATRDGAVKAGAGWLVATYAVITVGELFLSPMGLSLVSKISPQPLMAVMMGGWFLSTAVGSKLSGIVSGLFTRFEHKSTIFVINCVGATVAGLLIVAMLPRLKRVMGQYIGETPSPEVEPKPDVGEPVLLPPPEPRRA